MRINQEDYNDFYDRDRDESELSSGSLSPFTFLCLVLIMTGAGLLFLYSASSYNAMKNGYPHYHYLVKQLVFALAGGVVFLIVQKIPYRFFKYLAWPAIAISTIFLALTVFTPFGVTVLGARRWLNLPLLPSFQPSEFAKAALILFLAYWFAEDKHKKYIGWYYLIPILVISVTIGLIMLQKAFTTSVIVFMIAFLMLIVCGIKLRYMIIAAFFIAVPAVSILFCQSYRIRRIFSFLFPDVDTAGVNWQVSNSLKAIGSGGVFGKGMGNGEYKRVLPEIENDFIFANIGEEQGLMGMLFIIGLFALFAVLGFRAYERAAKYDPFSAYLAFGITTLISVQTVINLSVVLGLMPPTGIPLPFFSQGGTNLLIILSLSSLLYKTMKENTRNHGKE